MMSYYGWARGPGPAAFVGDAVCVATRLVALGTTLHRRRTPEEPVRAVRAFAAPVPRFTVDAAPLGFAGAAGPARSMPDIPAEPSPGGAVPAGGPCPQSRL